MSLNPEEMLARVDAATRRLLEAASYTVEDLPASFAELELELDEPMRSQRADRDHLGDRPISRRVDIMCIIGAWNTGRERSRRS